MITGINLSGSLRRIVFLDLRRGMPLTLSAPTYGSVLDGSVLNVCVYVYMCNEKNSLFFLDIISMEYNGVVVMIVYDVYHYHII